MSTMIYLTDPVTTRTRRRCFRIEIENPNIGTKRLSYHQQDITEDSNEVEISVKQANSLSFDVNDITTDIIEIIDPVTNNTINISGAAIALWLEAHYIKKATESLIPKTEITETPTVTDPIIETTTVTDPVTPQ